MTPSSQTSNPFKPAVRHRLTKKDRNYWKEKTPQLIKVQAIVRGILLRKITNINRKNKTQKTKILPSEKAKKAKANEQAVASMMEGLKEGIG